MNEENLINPLEKKTFKFVNSDIKTFKVANSDITYIV